MSNHPVNEKDITVTTQDHQPISKPEPTQEEKRPISSATASSSDKDVPVKSPEVSSAEQVVEKKTGEDGKDVKNEDETDYSSKAIRKTEFKHFLVHQTRTPNWNTTESRIENLSTHYNLRQNTAEFSSTCTGWNWNCTSLKSLKVASF
jgi:hypothetical protein